MSWKFRTIWTFAYIPYPSGRLPAKCWLKSRHLPTAILDGSYFLHSPKTGKNHSSCPGIMHICTNLILHIRYLNQSWLFYMHVRHKCLEKLHDFEMMHGFGPWVPFPGVTCNTIELLLIPSPAKDRFLLSLKRSKHAFWRCRCSSTYIANPVLPPHQGPIRATLGTAMNNYYSPKRYLNYIGLTVLFWMSLQDDSMPSRDSYFVLLGFSLHTCYMDRGHWVPPEMPWTLLFWS